MTEYLDHCEDAFIPCALHKSTLRYILEEFHDKPDLTKINYPEGYVKENGEALLQLMFDKSPINMRMYGSPKELAENIKIYKNFPMSHRYFNAELEPYFTTPIIHENLKKDQKFICKSDVFNILQCMVLRTFDKENCPLDIAIVPFFLKSQEKLDENVNFVPFDEKVFDEIWEEVQSVLRKYQHHVKNDRSFAILQDELWKLSIDQLLVKLKSFVSNTWYPDESEKILEILRLMKLHSKDFDEFSSKLFMAVGFTATRFIIEGLQGIIRKRPGLFKNQTKTVRLFEDGDKEFVMKYELFNVLKTEYEDPGNIFDTISFQDALGAYKDKLSNIEFIRYPIKRVKHRAVPVNGYDPEYLNEYCILAVDALFECLRNLISGHQFFQKFQNTNWIPLSNIFNALEFDFMPNHQTPYFLKADFCESMETVLETQLVGIATLSTKNIRNAKADGFTVQDLKNELIYLGLHLSFPEIQNHAEVVYAHVDKVKKEKILRTCDLIDAVEYCQLICFLERLPNYKKFLHNQGGCRRVPGLKCELCDKEKKNDEDQKKALELEGSKISGTESNSQITLKAVNSSENSDSKSSEVLKVTDSKMKASDCQLTELNTKIASLEAQLAAQSEMSTKLESDLLKATQDNELLHLEHIKLQSENEVNKGVMCQLIDKLSINQESPRSIPIVTSSTSLIECIICHIDIFNTQNTIKCPNCRTRFHKECALNYSKDHKQCPSCKGTIQESAICLN